MPRRPRVCAEGAIYQIYVRTARRERVLAEAERRGSRRRGRASVRLRDRVALVGVERYRITTRALAEALGQRPDHVSRWIGRAGSRKGEDGAFRDEVAELDRVVARQASRTRRRPKPAEKTS
jgi:hypothetical protein